MRAMPKVDVEGRIPVPLAVQDATGIHAGDGVSFHVVGPGHFEVYKQDEPEDPTQTVENPTGTIDENEALDWKALKLPIIPLRDLIALYRSDLPYDDAAIREEWQAEAGDELADRIRRGIE